MNHARLGRIAQQALVVLSFIALVTGVPLRGSRHASTVSIDGRQERRLMENKAETLAPTVVSTFMPTTASTVATVVETVPPGSENPLPATDTPSLFPSAAPISQSASPSFTATLSPTATVPATTVPATSVPTIQEQSAAPSTAVLPGTRELYPFSVRIEGTLEDENTFRMNLQSYLLKSMQEVIPVVKDISLTTTAVPFGLHLRSLQQATLLAYEGLATLDTSQAQLPTSDDVQLAQLEALQNSTNGGLQSYLKNESSSQTVTLLQIQVADFDPVNFEPPVDSEANTAPSSDDGGSNVGIIVGGVVAGLAFVVAVAIFVWQRTKPPPPPPYEFDQDDKVGPMANVVKLNDASIPVAITESTDSEGVQSPIRSPWSSPNKKTDEGMEVVALSKPSKKTRKRGIIDLRRPAKNVNGIEGSIQEAKPPPREDADADSTFDFIMEVQSVSSNADESMAGYSLVADLPERLAAIGKPVTPTRPPATTETKERAVSPEVQNKPQMRWFAQAGAPTPSFISSSSSSSPVSSRGSTPSKLTLDAVSDPLRDSNTGEKKDTEVFMDDDDEEVELVSRASSSYKEDDSYRGSSSVMSGISDTDGNVGTQAQNENALGFFYREHDEPNEDFDILPKRPPTQPVHSVADDLSDVPSDERFGNYQAEQDLTGFARAQNISGEMDEISGTMDNAYHSFASPSDISGEETAESMDAWARERRRIKRNARNRREERKQPPLTMEV